LREINEFKKERGIDENQTIRDWINTGGEQEIKESNSSWESHKENTRNLLFPPK